MTTDSDFKQLVRTRMRTTGESYTAARAQLSKPAAGESFETGVAAGGNTVFHVVTRLQSPEKGWSGLAVPSDFLGLRRRVGLRGTIDRKPFWASAQPMGDGNHWVNISKAWRAENGMRGDEDVDVVFVLDDNRPELVLPQALGQVLNGDGLRTAWEKQTFTARKDDARWVGDAKRPVTQARRAAAVAERLRQATSGKDPNL